jgi:hypothetical protein
MTEDFINVYGGYAIKLLKLKLNCSKHSIGIGGVTARTGAAERTLVREP